MSTIATATRLLASLALPLVPAFAQSLLSQAQLVLNEGDPVPGLPGHVVGIAFGTTLATSGLADAPVGDRSGNLLFRARISGPSLTNGDSRTDLVWLYGRTRDSLQVLLRSGDPDPTGQLGAGTVLYGTVGTQFVTGLGAGSRISAEQEYLLLPVALSGPAVVSTGTAANGRNDSALLLGQPGSLRKLVRRGDLFPRGGGSRIDTALSTLETQAMVLSPSGVATFAVTLVGGDVLTPGARNSVALLTGTPGNLTVAMRGGDPLMLSTGAHVVESIGSICQGNPLDQVLYEATLSTSIGVPPALLEANSCLLLHTPSVGSTVLVREGDLAPDCGFATYGDGTGASRPIACRGFGFLGAGWYSPITGQGVSSTNDTALFVGNEVAASLVVREGSVNPSLPSGERVAAIAPAAAYSDFEGGSIAFYATLGGAGITLFDDTAVILGRPGHLRFVAREGDPAPGFENVPGFVRAVFGNANTGTGGIAPGVVVLNDRGQVHFSGAFVTVTTAQGSLVHLCQYLFDPELGLRLLVDGGQVAPRVPGDVLGGVYGAQPVIAVTATANPTGDGGTLMLTADGDLAMRAQYSTGNGHGAILRAKFGALDCGPSEMSATLGGVHAMQLDGGPANAGMLYVVAATASGTRPGSVYGNAIVPLNPDALFVESILTLNAGPGIPWGQTFGLLDANGRGSATFTMPPGLSQFAGIEIHHAMVVLDPALAPRLVSPPCGLRLR